MPQVPARRYPLIAEIIKEQKEKHQREIDLLEQLADPYRRIAAKAEELFPSTMKTKLSCFESCIYLTLNYSLNTLTKKIISDVNELKQAFKGEPLPENLDLIAECFTSYNAGFYFQFYDPKIAVTLSITIPLTLKGLKDLELTEIQTSRTVYDSHYRAKLLSPNEYKPEVKDETSSSSCDLATTPDDISF